MFSRQLCGLGFVGLGCGVMRESGLTRKSGRMGRLFVFFTLGGETGLINENEGDI